MNHREATMIEVKKVFDVIPTKSVLEIGPREDTTFKDYFEHKGAKWTGMDLVQEIDGVIYGKMENLPFPDNSFDIIFVCHAFEHCERPVEALSEFKRVGRKILFMSTPNHCKHQILGADSDHIFCLTEMQMERLFIYGNIKKIDIHTQKENIEKEQDYNLISVGDLENEKRITS